MSHTATTWVRGSSPPVHTGLSSFLNSAHTPECPSLPASSPGLPPLIASDPQPGSMSRKGNQPHLAVGTVEVHGTDWPLTMGGWSMETWVADHSPACIIHVSWCSSCPGPISNRPKRDCLSRRRQRRPRRTELEVAALTPASGEGARTWRQEAQKQ